MVKTSACPDGNQLNKLAAAELPPNEMEPLLYHLQECSDCLAKAQSASTRDTLPDLVAKAKTLLGEPQDPLLASVIGRLSSLGQTPATAPKPLVFACAACGKTLEVKADLAGKKVKCSACARVIAVPLTAQPQASVRAASSENRSLPPQQDHSATGLFGASAGNQPATRDDTQGFTPATDKETFDFLQPAQQPDELGRLGPYRILEKVGAGGMGMVFLAEDTLLGRKVALKTLLPQFAANAMAKERFLREARAAASIEHEHIVPIFQVGEDNNVPFLAMPFLKGEPLDVCLQREGKLPVPRALGIAREMAEGLAAANNLIHRDIKPGNVWLEGDKGKVRLLDFGLARTRDDTTHLTQAGSIVGTPAYMAPEQARGEKIDGRADLFSLGCVLYVMLTGQRPFKGNDTMSLLMSLALEEPTLPTVLTPEVPDAVSDLTMRLLAKDPADRPASATEVAETLRSLAPGGRPRDQMQSLVKPRPTKPQPTRRRRTPVLVAGALAAGLIVVAAVALIRIGSAQGDYVIETDDPEISFKVSKGTVTVVDDKSKRPFHLKVVSQDKDKFVLEVTDPGNDLVFTTDTFTIKRGKKLALKAWFERKPGAVVAKPVASVDDPWPKQVAALPTAKQVQAVAAKLKELNPGFDGQVAHVVKGGVVTELQFVTDKVTDVAPVRALTGLRTLNCGSNHANGHPLGQLADLSPLKDMKLTSFSCDHTKVTDLSPLKDMKLTFLSCYKTQVADLSPLRDMKLTTLHCDYTPVSDLSPLKDMKLTTLTCPHTPVSDLSPLKDMKLTSLYFADTPVSDLSPLKGMPLIHLNCLSTKVADLSPLKGMPLTELICLQTPVSDLSPLKDLKLTRLWCSDTLVSDLSPLKDMKLTNLHCAGTKVSDLSPLKGMPLKEVRCDFEPKRDRGILRSIKTLETINGKPAAEFWKEVDAQVATFDAWLKQVAALPSAKQVQAVAAKLKELNPGFDGQVAHVVKGGVVTELQFVTDKVTDIAPVRALTSLRSLNCGGTYAGGGQPNGQLADLSPLKDLKLTALYCDHTKVTDLSPLKDMKLTFLSCYKTPVADLSPLKGMPLTYLHCWMTQVSDLSPLKGMKLTHLECGSTRVSDLSPLKGMPLTWLGCSVTKVSDLSPLKGMPLTELLCSGTKVSDLSPLRGMPLKALHCDFKPERDAEILRSIKTLEKINGKPAKEVLAAMK